MASTTPTASSLSRYRPVVLTITGAAIAYGFYLLYTNTRSAPSTTLHRSNAIHRRERPRRFVEQAQGSEATTAQEETERIDGHGIVQSRPYGIFICEEAGSRQRHRFPLYPGRLPDVDWFQRVCHHERHIAQRFVEEAQRQFINNYLDHEVDALVRLGDIDGPAQETSIRVYDQLLEWGLPPHLIENGFHRHNSRITAQTRTLPPTDGALDVVTLPTSNIQDNETEASWDNTEYQTGGVGDDAQNGDGHALRRTLYYIAEDQARQKGIVHRGITCDGCRTTPIRGIRWRCTNCIDYDLCSDCEATNIHPKTHMFQKVKIPARYLGYTRNPMPVYFPGNPNFMPILVPNAVKKVLEEETSYEPEEIEGLWEQFTCLANTPWNQDPHKLGAAIDRRAFDKAFVPRYTANIPAPNLVYDRVFTFFDSNGDGVIGFEEFVKGMDYIRMPQRRRAKLKKIFECYDIDGDGFVTRKDFLRIFRAYYNILREKTRDMLMVAEEGLSVAGVMDTIESSQPLSSVFTNGPDFSTRRNDAASRKATDRFGDPQQDQEVVRENRNDVEERSQLIADAGEIRGNRISGLLPQPSSIDSVRSEAVADRWRRREFYIDEEEGLTAPENFEEDDRVDGTTAGEEATSPSADQTDGTNGIYHRPSMSRSSSRVRFADDLESDARSEASTSSRPIGERWGGYEIPEAEEDLGKDILYQVTQQGTNEMLDPVFRRKEDLALEVQATKAERSHWRSEIERFAKHVQGMTCADFYNDPLLRCPEAEALLDISFQFVTLVTGPSWRRYQAAREHDLAPDEEVSALNGFVEDMHQPFERFLKTTKQQLSSESYKAAVDAARNLIAKAARRITAATLEGPSRARSSSGAEHEARLEADLVDMQLDELLERAGYTVERDNDTDMPDDTVRAVVNTIGQLVGERTTGSEADGESGIEARRDAETLIEATRNMQDSSLPPQESRSATFDHVMPNTIPLTTQSTISQLPPNFDPTMPQFRPNSAADLASVEAIASQDFNQLAGSAVRSLPTNTTAPPQLPEAPEIPVPVPPGDYRDPTMPQFRPNADRGLPPRTSSLNPPLTTTSESSPERNAISNLTASNSASMTLDPTIFVTGFTPETSVASSSEDESSSSISEDDDDHDDEDDDEDENDTDPDHPNNLIPIPTEILTIFSAAAREQRNRDAIQSSNRAAQQPNPFLSNAYKRRKAHETKPDDVRLARLAMLEGVERELVGEIGEGRRAVKGGINFDEFVEAMTGRAGGALMFIEGWLELGSL